MRYLPLPADLYIRNRQKFMRQMQPGTAAVFFSNDIIPVNADAHYPFSQNSNFFYLTGIDQEGCILWLFPDAPRPEWREVLFILETNEKIQLWEGWKFNISEARAASGIEQVFFSPGFENYISGLLPYVEGIYLDFNEHERNKLFVATAAHRLAYQLRDRYPGHRILRAAPLLYKIRMVKEKEEIQQLCRACRITTAVYHEIAASLAAGRYEFEIEARIVYGMLRRGATGPAYGSIIAAGKNACVLHYVLNNAACQAGDLVLMDFGAEYGGYSADLTRCLPVGGKFSPRQQAIYEACLRVFKFAQTQLRPGNTQLVYSKAVAQYMENELLELGLLTTAQVKEAPYDSSNPAYKKYFPHGIGHHLGLDTHDVNAWYDPFAPGMVLTVEPGIYVPEEGIGVRIETDVLLTQNQPIDLMPDVPLEVAQIEALMANPNPTILAHIPPFAHPEPGSAALQELIANSI
jgi:Xaa-Pro aminopeptidase